MGDVSLGNADWDTGTMQHTPDAPSGTAEEDISVEALLPKRRVADEEATVGVEKQETSSGNADWGAGEAEEEVGAGQDHQAVSAVAEAPQSKGQVPEEGKPVQAVVPPGGGDDGLLAPEPAPKKPPKQAFDVPTSGAFWCVEGGGHSQLRCGMGMAHAHVCGQE